MPGVPDHLRSMVARVRGAPITKPPDPWRQVGVYTIGGLTDVGFAPRSDLLLVVSSTGRGLFDCVNGQKLARDPSAPNVSWHDPYHLEAQAIGPLTGAVIRTAGQFGGGLPRLTRDGWSTEKLTLDWPDVCLLLVAPGSWIYGEYYGKPADFTKVAVESEVRAWGFSPTGRSLVLASSSDFTIFGRGLALLKPLPGGEEHEVMGEYAQVALALARRIGLAV